MLETLREGREFIFYRGRQQGHPSQFLVLTPIAQQPTPTSLKRLNHEYSLATELDAAWAARPLALTRHDGRMMLVLEDLGGKPLDRTLGRPLELTRSLRVAISLAAALGQVHRHGLIHKNIKPSNVLVDAAGNVRLTGFGIASRLLRERQAPAPPEVIAGTLAYMAPEQTGHMNRSIDSRSDLYAYGVTLYEMLTGVLPFTATDPMEWVHCHIARHPVPPSERTRDIPGPVEAIVMKLLAKTAEDRYQTAAGVEADLRRCLIEWESLGRIDRFPLGAHDVPDRLLIPEKLYGRDREIHTLLASFDRVVATGTPELVLISGYSGIGKSSVVNELHKVLVPPRGLFASGKFAQYKRDIPYATLAQALHSLVRQLLSKSDVELARWRAALLEALGPNGQLMVNVIPELVLIIGEQPPVPDLPPQDAQNRFQFVFRRFLGVFARPEHPLVLCLDDLQWLDTATLELLEHLVTDADVRHLLVIGAYRYNEVNASHPLARTLDVIRNAGARVQEIVLAPLVLDDVAQLVADALHAEREDVRPFAELVFEKTGGNPFFAIQFVTGLAEEGLLAFDPDGATWSWDLARIRAKVYTDNVVDFMVGKIARLPTDAQEVLKQLACLGNSAALATLSLVCGRTEDAIHVALQEAARAEFVTCMEGAYTFLHDRIQEAAYALISDDDRAANHLRIARLLAAHTPPEKRLDAIFDIVNQFNRGSTVMTSREECEQVAELNLMAGTRARAATAYASALNYLVAGEALLAEDSWERCYPLAFATSLRRAECEFLTGGLAAAEERLSVLARRATNLADRAAVACLSTGLYVTVNRPDRAIEICLDYLRSLGIVWTAHPTDEEVRQEYEEMQRQLGGRSAEALIDLPLMTDPEWRATMDVLHEATAPSFCSDANLFALVMLRMANISLAHGNCDASCPAYVCLGMVLRSRFGEVQSGFRFGQLSVDLVEKRGLTGFKARVYHTFGTAVVPWTQPLRSGRELMRRAFAEMLEIGDLTYAGLSSQNLISNMISSGDPLEDVQREAEAGLAFAHKARFGLVLATITGQLMLIRALRGLPPAVAVGDAVYHERQFEEYLKDHPGLAFAASSYWVRKLQARFFAADYTSAIDAAGQAQPLLWITTDLFEAADYHFYAALTRAAVWNAASAAERTSHRAALLAHHAPLVRWAENCPENFTDRATLVAAEIAGIDGRELDAERLYEEAIRLAREHSFIQNEGVANELAARFYAARGYETIANAYLRNARSCYLRWGADGKVRLLDQTYPHLRQEPASRRSDSTIGTPIEQLDLATVVKVSQAVSSEVDLKKLIDTLMVTALEHAGGDRSLLILPHGGELWIEAEATTGRDTVDVLLRPRVVMPSELPESMLYFVIRTQESVVLDDASAPNQFSADEYIRERHSRSVLCLPLVKQASLVGVLYLENSLAPHVFTPARIAVLKLLASQAAISLENAHLYTNAQKMEAYLEAAQRLSHTGSFGWRPATGEILWSEETYRIVGYDPGIRPTIDLVFQRIHPEDIDRVQEALDRAVQDRTDLDFEHRLLMTDGAVKYVRVVGHPSKEDKSGNLEFVGAVTDITERKQLEGQLLEGQERFRLLSESSLTGIYLIQEGRFRYVNPVMARMFGYKIEEVVDRLGPLDLTYPDDRHIVGENIRRRVEGDLEEVRYEFRGLRRDGLVFYIEVHGRRIEHGGKIGVIGTLVDITERKQAEEERRAHLWFLESMDQVNRSIQGTNDLEQMMSDVLDAVLSIFNCDRAWLVYPCDPEAASWKVPMEHTRPEFPGAFALGLDLPLDPEIAKVFQTVRASSTPVRFGPASEHPLPVEVAKRFSIQSIIAMAIYPKRDKPYMLGLHQCSYPRAWTPQEERLFQEIGRRLEDALTSLLMFRNLGESEHKLEQAQRLTHVGYWERNADTDLITWADETYRIFGLPSQGQILNLAQLSELIHPEDKQIMVQALAEALGGGPRYDVEYRVIRPNGEVRLVHSQGDITKDESGRPRRIFGTIQDITERKRAEQRLVVQHTVTQMLAEAATLPEATPKILQTVCEFLLWDLGVLWSIDQEAGMLRCVEVWHKESVEAPQFEAICRECTFMRGIGLPGRVWSSREPAYIPDVIHDANFPRGPIAAREGLHAAFGFPILLGGDVLGVMEFFSHEIRQPEQELLNMMATIGSQIGQFIEGKRAEERLHKAQAELAHVTRVTTLGEMTASIAHEINQPLAAVVNNASACLRWLAAHNLEEARQSAALIIADGHRAGKIISGIRALAKNAPPQKDWVNINETILEVIALTRNEVQGNRVALQTELSDELPPVLGDRIQLQQVILNLVMNGIEAMSAVVNRSRDLHIRSRRHESDKVLVEVQDSGAGLEAESLDRLFTAFFTTKPKGMGMGLAISRSIIEPHGGRLWAAPNDGAGATFQFTLHVGIKEERPLIA